MKENGHENKHYQDLKILKDYNEADFHEIADKKNVFGYFIFDLYSFCIRQDFVFFRLLFAE